MKTGNILQSYSVRLLKTLSMQLLFVLVLLMGSVGVSGQIDTACYKIEMSESGYGTSMYSDVMKDTLCDLVSIVDEIDGNNATFSIVSYDLATVDKYKQPDDIDYKIQSIKDEVASKYTEYIAIIKQFKEGDIVGFRVFLKLPNVEAFDTLTTMEKESIASSVETTMNSYVDGVSSVNVAELKGLVKFNEHIRAIQDGGFDIHSEELYLKLKKECIPLFKIDSVFEKPIVSSREESGIESRYDTSSLVEDDTDLLGVYIEGYGYFTMDSIVQDIEEKLSEYKSNGVKNVKAIILDQRTALNGNYEAAKYHVKDEDYGLVVTFYYDIGHGNQVFYKIFDPHNIESPVIPNDTKYGDSSLKSYGSDSSSFELSGVRSSTVIGGVHYDLSYKGLIGKNLGAIGYVMALNGTAANPVFGASGSIGVQRLIFTYGDYSGYPYTYVFNELSYAVGYDFSIDASLELCLAGNYGVGDYDNPKPSDLEGDYNVLFGVDANLEAGLKFGGTSQINVPVEFYNKDHNKRWMTWTIGINIGLSGDLTPLSGTFRSTIPEDEMNVLDSYVGAKCILVTEEKKTKDRSIWDKSIAWLRFFNVAPDTGILDYLGKKIVELVK